MMEAEPGTDNGLLFMLVDLSCPSSAVKKNVVVVVKLSQAWKARTKAPVNYNGLGCAGKEWALEPVDWPPSCCF